MDFRRKLSSGGESFSEGTSRFFTSMMAKKNGLMNDLSNKIDSVSATLMNSSPSGSSLADSDSQRLSDEDVEPDTNVRTARPKEKALKDRQNSEEKSSAVVGANNNGKVIMRRFSKQRSESSSSVGSISDETFAKPGAVNMSFDEPIYTPNRVTTPDRSSPSIGPRWKQSTPPSIPPPPYNPNKTGRRSSTNSPKMSSGHSSDSEKYTPDKYTPEKPNPADKATPESDEKTRPPSFAALKRRSSTVDEMLFDDYQPEPEPEDTKPSEEEKVEEENVFNKRKTLLPMGDLISFDEPELEDFHPRPIGHQRNKKMAEKETSEEQQYASVSSVGSDDQDVGLNTQTSVESSEPEYTDEQRSRRLDSVGSEKSWSSNYSLDSQPDDLTLECMSFMKMFVAKIFNSNEDISQMEKSKFGEHCQQVPGRQWFARYVNSQRVVSKKVEESIFFRLVQYFAVVLFECNEAEDYVPAKSLMNMCFTFYHEVRRGKSRSKNFLYSYLREQPIWQSLRFWNAAFFDSVQNERARKPTCTSDDGLDSKTDDAQFQENVTFGQLGTFTSNMRAFGLSKELCLEFLRKQSTIADLKRDQIKMLKENVEKWKDH